MFKKIGNIDNFGVFNNFTGGILPEFAPFNIIYGWNYSGKTTLSRIFRCLEKGVLHPDYPQARFSIIDDNSVQFTQQFKVPCNVRVFNEDFRKQHLLWDETDGFSPILLLGSENITLRETLAELEAAREEADNRSLQAASEKKRLHDAILQAETDCASKIVNELPVGRFNRVNLRPIIEAWKGSLPEGLSADKVKAARLKVAAEQKEELPDLALEIDAAQTAKLWQNGAELLSEQLGSSGTIHRLITNPGIASWVEQGHHLHKGMEQCEFCEGRLMPQRIQDLNAHFSNAYDDLKRRIALSIEGLTAAKSQISDITFGRAAFYTDLHFEYDEAIRQLVAARDNWNSSLDQLIDALKRKQIDPFDVVEQQDDRLNAAVFSAAIDRFAALIESCNNRTKQFNAEREAAITTLKVHITYEAMQSVNRFSKERRISDLKEEEECARCNAAALKMEINKLQTDLSNATRGADAINDTLHQFFGKADIQVRVTEDDRFRLMRGAEPARNLSEGERTAIAFCYFITKLLESGNDLSQTIVYIDDPISSLDAHHLLHVCAFIRNIFYKRNQTSPMHECLAKQLFISTHSHEFFHLMLDWVTKMKRPMSETFLVERIDNNGRSTSRLIECPESIRKYRSEYLYLFHQLTIFAENPRNDHQVIFNLGNMTRRFVEGYVAFKYMEHANVDGSIGDLISDPVEAERARKFMHFYSHTFSRGGGMWLPDMSEAQAVINSILGAIREHDPVHYEALETTRKHSEFD